MPICKIKIKMIQYSNNIDHKYYCDECYIPYHHNFCFVLFFEVVTNKKTFVIKMTMMVANRSQLATLRHGSRPTANSV